MDFDLDKLLILKMLFFVISGFVGMVFAFYRAWSFLSEPVPLLKYLLGDNRAIGRAITTLLVMSLGATSLDLLINMSFNQIFMTGIGIGILVPDSVAKKQKED